MSAGKIIAEGDGLADVEDKPKHRFLYKRFKRFEGACFVAVDR